MCAAARQTCQVHGSGLQAHEIETALWKWVFYKPIEEFRHRVRYAADAGEKGEEPLRKVWQLAVRHCRFVSVSRVDMVQMPIVVHTVLILAQVKAALLKFLDEATTFYMQLITDLQSTFGDIGLRMGDGQSTARLELHASQPLSTRHPASVVSIYRCLICLGDLAR